MPRYMPFNDPPGNKTFIQFQGGFSENISLIYGSRINKTYFSNWRAFQINMLLLILIMIYCGESWKASKAKWWWNKAVQLKFKNRASFFRGYFKENKLGWNLNKRVDVLNGFAPKHFISREYNYCYNFLKLRADYENACVHAIIHFVLLKMYFFLCSYLDTCN